MSKWNASQIREMEFDDASGDLDVTLPADTGFTVTMDTMSGDVIIRKSTK